MPGILPVMVRQWCDSLFHVVCMTPRDEFPFWDVLASVVVTGFVTWLTILVSVRASRRATERTIEASLESEARARAERERDSARQAQAESLRQRTALAAALSRGAYLLQTVRGLPDRDRDRVEAEAEWSALRVSFSVSTAPFAADLYEFADLRIDDALKAGPPPGSNSQEPFVEYFIRTTFSDKVSDAASYWVKHAALEDGVAKELAKLRLGRERQRRDTDAALMNMLRNDRDSPPPEEADIFADDPEGSSETK